MSLAREAGHENQEALLVARLLAGEDRAFEEVLRVHGARLLAVARKFSANDDDAQDVLQEALLSAFRSIASFQGEARLATWLHRIVVNAALMRRRSQGRRRETDFESLMPAFKETGVHFIEPPSSWQEAADLPAQREETRALVRRCIDELPDNYRIALTLRDIEECEIDDIARHLGITANAVKIRVHRARQALRALLDPHMSGVGE